MIILCVMTQIISPPLHASNIQSFHSHFPQLGVGVYVHNSATVIGHVNLGENVSVWPGAVIRGDINFIKIGAGSNIQDCAVLHVNNQSISDPNGAPLIIGENVTVGDRKSVV